MNIFGSDEVGRDKQQNNISPLKRRLDLCIPGVATEQFAVVEAFDLGVMFEPLKLRIELLQPLRISVRIRHEDTQFSWHDANP